MALTGGDRFGVYHVRELLGAGGMGEVYRGHDSRLNRSVAIKVLPDTFARDPDRLARFKREAQVLASLNHPHIGSIYGFEESDGMHALVLELVEGPTLADRIAQGPLPLDEALPIARQLTEALDAAHVQGIVHRDLKPANIKVRPDATVKVLDFGLAKALAGDTATASVAQSPTITSPALTQMGVILGTAAYLSPEQARGRSADKRSDIWAFGAVLYEMVTGKRAFDGDDLSYTLANVLKSEPDWGALPADTPLAVRRLLRRCLEKDPKNRLHDIADARLDLDEKEAAAAALPAPRGRSFDRERIVWAALAALLAGALAYTAWQTPSPPRLLRFQVDAPEGTRFGSSSGWGWAEGTSGAMLSPDGTQLVFVATSGKTRTELWLQRFDSFRSRSLPGTDGALMPFWAPDSRRIGFFAADKLKTIDTGDGSVQTIANATGVPRGGTWGSRDVIVYSAGIPLILARIPARGGEITVIQRPDGTNARPGGMFPSFLPDGRHFVFSAVRPGATAELMVGSTEPGFEARTLVGGFPNMTSGLYAPPGVLLFMKEERLVEQPFDVERLELTGEATPVAGVPQVFYNPGVGRADFTVSSAGVLAFRTSSNRGNQFAWFDRAGNLLEPIGSIGNYRTADLSPDGQRLVYSDVSDRSIWIMDLARGNKERFANGGSAPVWFPDGTKIAYRKDIGLFEKDVGGTGDERLLLNERINGPDQVSADGKWILYFGVTPSGNMDVFVVPTTGERKPQALAQTPSPEVEPQFDPSGRWLAYASRETGTNEIYLQAFPSTGRRWSVSTNGGRQPLWRADGKELFFVSDDARFYVVSFAERDGLPVIGKPEFLFDMRANVFNARNSYIPSRDGKRFLINMVVETEDAPISVVHHWRSAAK